LTDPIPSRRGVASLVEAVEGAEEEAAEALSVRLE
jgi:hypothetical protein